MLRMAFRISSQRLITIKMTRQSTSKQPTAKLHHTSYLDVRVYAVGSANSSTLDIYATSPLPPAACTTQRRTATIRGPRHFLRSGPLPSDLK